MSESTCLSSLQLKEHPFFTSFTDPESGITSYVLTEKVAPLQKAFYFIRSGLSKANQNLWFYAAHPPSKKWHLAAVSLDPNHPEAKFFPQCPLGGNPVLHPTEEAVYVVIEDGIYLQHIDGRTEEVFRMPAGILQGRHLFRLCTDLTIDSEGKNFLLDSQIGNRTLISTVEIATGELTPLRWFSRAHHHAIFSWHDPTLFLLNQQNHHDPITGDKVDMDVRIWFMNTTLTTYEPIDPGLWFNQNSKSCHEWWTRDGKVQWCDYDDGIYEIDLANRQKTIVWERPLTHGNVDPTGQYLCGDQFPYKWNETNPCSVWAFNRKTGKEVPLVSRMPPIPISWQDFRVYHIDPHPQFSEDGQSIHFTSSIFDQLSLTITPLEEIAEKTSYLP